MKDLKQRVIIRDVTLREGLDVEGVNFSLAQRLKIAELLSRAGVPEIEVVAPAKVSEDIGCAERLKCSKIGSKISGLIYAHGKGRRREIEKVSLVLDRFDVLMPLAGKREPFDKREKMRLLLEMLEYGLQRHARVGVGFPHALSVEFEFLSAIAQKAVERGAERVTIYDTGGRTDPFTVHEVIRKLRQGLDTVLFFHAHNDLGLATANSLAAVHAGACGLDTTINGIGDRAGNAAFEQVVMNLHAKKIDSGVVFKDLKRLSKVIEEYSGLTVSKLAPVVGEYSFSHKSPAHLNNPALFEAFSPGIVGLKRKIRR